MGKGVLLLVLLSLSACKFLQKPAATLPPERRECLSQPGHTWVEGLCHPPAEGFLTKEACEAIWGARWESGTQACRRPSSQDDCAAIGQADVLWDGASCTEASARPNFYRLCNDANTSGERLYTIDVMTRALGSVSCQQAFDQLRQLTKMSYQGQALRDLSPFAGFPQLESLDLWNNRISELTSLGELPALKKLNLSHNELVDIGPLRLRGQLTDLILSENKITDISPLKELENLEFLDISSNMISDFSPLIDRKFSRGYFFESNRPEE